MGAYKVYLSNKYNKEVKTNILGNDKIEVNASVFQIDRLTTISLDKSGYPYVSSLNYTKNFKEVYVRNRYNQSMLIENGGEDSLIVNHLVFQIKQSGVITIRKDGVPWWTSTRDTARKINMILFLLFIFLAFGISLLGHYLFGWQ